jgi:glycosyltransferase involved in cell wall biosynthesis
VTEPAAAARGAAARATVIVPAYQPDAAVLLRLVHGLAAQGFADFIVVDDGSDEAHQAAFRGVAALPGVRVLRHAVNLGKGAALRTGFNAFLNRNPDGFALTIDADGQHAPEDARALVETAAAHHGFLILGRRRGSAAAPLRSRVGNALTRFVFRLISGAAIDDTQTGLRVWPRALVEASLRSTKAGYDFEMEALLWAIRNRIPWRQVDIQKLYFDENRGSHFDPVWDSLLIYWVIVRFCLGSIIVACTDYVLFFFLHRATGEIATSIALSRGGAALLAFAIARNVVFRDTDRHVFRQLARFLALVAFLGVLSVTLTSALVSQWGMPAIAAKALAEGGLLVVSFTLQRHLVFWAGDPRSG